MTRREEAFVADMLSNADNSTDEEIVDCIWLQSTLDQEELTKLVKTERPKVALDFRYEIPFHLYNL